MAADGRGQVLAGESLLLHAKQKPTSGIGRRDVEMFLFVLLDQQRQQLQLLLVGRSRLGIHQLRHTSQRSLLLRFGLDYFGLH